MLLKEKRRSGGRIGVPLAFATLPCLHEQANPEEGGESAGAQMDQGAHIRELFPLRFVFLFDIAKALVPFCDFPGGEEAVSVAHQGRGETVDEAANSGKRAKMREYGHTYDGCEVMLMKMFLSEWKRNLSQNCGGEIVSDISHHQTLARQDNISVFSTPYSLHHVSRII